ncbi:MAG: hypothetical protein JNJ63_07625 [Hyphomonadaceae bacterium]|nr:hypothetical protein [Hyphomonadaceae bacterium]
MTSQDATGLTEAVRVRALRFALALAVVAAAWFALDAVIDSSVSRGYGQGLFGLGFLFLVPFAIGLVLGVAIQRIWPSTRGVRIGVAASGIFFVLSFLTGPGVICVVMAAPLWFPSLVLGSWASNWIVLRSPLLQVAAVALVLVLACGVWSFEDTSRYPAQEFTVERMVTISAAPETVWPHLLRLDALSSQEGIRTASHDILGVPRPVEAIVSGEGVGAVRTGRWSGGVWFEEHIVAWSKEKRLDWVFVFPEGSTFASIDQHIDPRGPNVVIRSGGYQLDEAANGSTRLRLYTTYSLNTAVNGYAERWAELILGDVQNNILEIVRERAEANSVTQGLVLAAETGANE